MNPALLTAVQLHVATDEVTLTLPAPPCAENVWEVGKIEKVQPTAASWFMATAAPATVNIAVRAAPAFCATENLTVPFPVPLLPDVIVTKGELLAAVQVQFVADAVTVMAPVPPAAAKFWLVDEIENVQATAPAWVTVNSCPAIVIVPLRAGPVF